jgi:hypothetical protein
LGNIARVAGITAGLMLPGILFAQYYDDPGLGDKPVAAHPQDYKPLGIRAGSFMLHPGVQLAAEFTDNAFYSTDFKESDTIFHIRPYITAQSTWSKHSLSVSLAADIARYVDFGFRDYEDYFLIVSGRVDVKSRSYFSYGLNYMNLHEGLNNRDSEQGLKPTRYDLYGANVGYDHTFNRFSLGVALNWDRLDFDNSYSLITGEIDNQDRDRDQFNWMVRGGYQFKTDMQAFVSYTGYKVNYKEPIDRNGFERSGDGYTVNGGVSFAITGKLNGDLYASYNDRSYDSPELPDTSGWGGGAGLQWNPTYLTSVYGRIDTNIQETTNEYASGYLRTLYSVRVDHELLRFLQINGFVSYTDNDYQLIDFTPPDARAWDKIFRAGIGLSWFINRHLFLNASYDYEKLKTNVPDDGYNVNRIWLTLGIER